MKNKILISIATIFLLVSGNVYGQALPCDTASLARLGINPEHARALGCDAVKGDFLPSTDGTYDLGSSSYEWQDLYVDGTANLDAAVITTLTYSKSITITQSAFNAAVGGTAGFTAPTGLDKALLVCPASQTAATAVIPISGLMVGDVITAVKITGQVESAGNTATVDADLRKLTPAAAGTADASIGAITQISKTADYAIADSKTLASAETVASGESFYVLVTVTTAASTDVEISSVELTVTRTY